jgi:release factor glutamine methyltransferase
VNIQEALAFGQTQLNQSLDPTLDARLLLEFVLARSHAYLAAHREESLTAVQEEQYRRLVERAARHEPIPYLTGRAYFFGRSFKVTPAVLIPRPETEQLVEQALKWLAQAWVRNGNKPVVVDVGTGSGCIAVTIALDHPEVHVEAVDISEAALAVARENAAAYGVSGRIHFHLGSLLEPLDGCPDLIIANLPYIADAEWTAVPVGVKSYEPVTALRGGPTGLDLIQQLLTQAAMKLSPEGAVFLEIGWQQGPAVKEMAQTIFPAGWVEIFADYAGHDRIISIVKSL